ncbi:MAG: hypothetical protein K2N72_00680, partial [Oscillospiraceae bacterium]|nr:hypothetical protein [Oscillospiraceae bacterium]
MEKKFDIAEGGARRSVMRFCAFAAALALTAGVIPTASAEDEPEAAVTGAETAVTVDEIAEEQTEAAVDTPVAVEASFDASVILPDSEELEANYIEGLFYGNNGIALYGNYGSGLSGDALSIYNELKAGVAKIVSGQTTSTVIPVTITDYDNAGNNYQMAFNALLVDLPEQLYWFDKTAGARLDGDSKNGVTVSFTVSDKYLGSGGGYTVDPGKITTAQTAVNSARAIAAKYDGKSDYEKIVGYCTEICALTEYNRAVLNGTDNDDDAYQMVYVFDGDESTKVVCEGYSKAFQYLCDMGDVECYTVTGTMEGGTGAGPHMWNIVKLNGKSYLVDVTNCDGDSVGAPDKLLLKGATTAGASGCYFEFDALNYVRYTYDRQTLSMYSEALLTVSAEDYDPTAVPVEPAPGGEDETTVTEPADPAVSDTDSSESVSGSETPGSESVSGSETPGSESVS